MGRLDGRVAVITGGANGIGRETVLRFLDEGSRVVVADLNVAGAEAVLKVAAEKGQRDAVRFVRPDVAREEAVEAMVRGALGPITEAGVDEGASTLAVLLRGVSLGMKHGARAMKAQGQGGSIISTSSIAGFAGGGGGHRQNGRGGG